MRDVVLLTGATGFLGSHIAARLIEHSDCLIIALVRAQDPKAGSGRLRRAWWDLPALAAEIGGRVEVLEGDVSVPRLGLDETTYQDLIARVTHVIHSAADLRVDASLEELRRTNVEGTAHVVELAREIQRRHGLARLAHISTAYVAGRRSGPVLEESLSDEAGFSSAYEQSKYEAERLVRGVKIPVSIFRPGMVIGDSRTGAIKTFNTVYFPLRLYLAGKLRFIPAPESLPLSVVPVDYVADAVVRLTFDARAEGLTFHLTPARATQPTAGELLRFTRAWARKHLNLQLPRPVFVPLGRRGESWLRSIAARRTGRKAAGHGALAPDEPGVTGGARPARGTLQGLRSLLPYFGHQPDFRRDNVERLLGPYDIQWREVLPRVLDYAVSKGFLHRSERTVHEQILFRMGSRTRPVTYYDVVDGNPVARDTLAVRQDMLSAIAALRALGVQPGDRVALVGLNSTRYLTLDVAIGMVGAISVPCYYTSPPADIDAILAASGARLLFIGSQALLNRLHEFKAQIPVISFCQRSTGDSAAEGTRSYMPWHEFLALGEGCLQEADAPESSPAGPGDLATLRYTSGTTGQPKGAAFRHDSLRWMGESLASLMPWPIRNHPVSYLSFLPMNHVVEGILATYAPYYIPAPVNIYFLEEFRDIQRALPQVRPTIFFSVPRFYEKVWEALSANRLGALYLASFGWGKRLLRPLLRRGALRRAGLDRCVQLLVGSAPASETLLRNFGDLGIDLHNAYGLTEAPLVTLNRLGANRLGTVGQPLPETELRVAEDGELLVRGPQVMAGYFGEVSGEQPFQEGWLRTGDLGHLDGNGYAVIDGRKKELIATSYGKKVFAAKVEAMLREVPGISEAMLVGENRPYCVALLWVRESMPGAALGEAIDRAIAHMNEQLSHPEQVKRWAILPDDLSVEGGDLTANLKLKRQAVARRLDTVLAALYGEAEVPSGVLHLGAALRG